MINRLFNHIHRFLAQDLREFKTDISNLFVRALNSIKLLPVLMEDKRLNINQPLLSVRRLSPKAASQKNGGRKFGSYLPHIPSIEPCRTEFKLDPLKNTGNIPFVWEHSPGKPKDETNKQIQIKENPLGLPKLPPGRNLKPRKKDSENINEDHIHIPTHTNVTNIRSSLQNVFQTETKKKETSDSSDDTNEEFMDALDTLSRGDQSSFYNCSASGATVTHESDVNNPSGNLKSDPKLGDFMMGRFLPAAKAMASEPPLHHAARKHFIKENPREIKKLANMENKKFQLRYGPTFDVHDNEEEDEDSDHEYYEHGNTSKFCGLLPRFCSRGSLNLVGPVPGISMRTRTPFSSFIERDRESTRPGTFARSQLPKQQDSVETANQKNFNYPKLEGSKLYNRLQGCGISAGFSESFQSLVSENDSTQQKRRLSFKELLNGNKHKIEGQDSISEKTLYVDTENSIPSSINKADDELENDVETEVVDERNGDQNSKDSEDCVFERPAAPPLPKSPSDSWLGRTLPSVSSKRWNPRFRSSNVVSTDTESDKSTQLRIPKGPLLPIPES
ncbi:hypothetical protein L1887_33786 [Cichorium endivia]|nr:hypothetical protein L1887_33786 [Cichorium endivia]